MAAHATTTGGRIRQVGKVVTEIVIVNRVDEALAERGLRPAETVPRVQLSGVLVDTGATTLCLPIDVVRRLGLSQVDEVSVATASGEARVPLYQDAKITVEGRTGTFECLALPEGSPPLLGVIPLEMLGLEPDLQNQRLRILPDTGRDTYMLAPSPIIY